MPSIGQAEWRHVAGASPSFGPCIHSKRGLWKVSQPELLLNLVAMPLHASGTLTFW